MGKNTVEAPDYAPLAQASRESAQIMRGLGEQQLAFAREQYDRSAPILERIANQQMAAQNEQMNQARDYYNYMRDTYRPVERGLVQDAQRFNTEAYRNQLASQAAADAGRAFGIAQQQNQRAMGAMGVNPNSGRFNTSNQAQANALAAQRAAAMTGARTQAEQMGYARRLDAAGLGRGLAGASTAAYGGATGAGSQAGANAQSAGMNYMAGMGQGASTIGSGLNMQMTGLSNILNNQTSAYVNSNDSFLGDLGGFLGGAASAYTAFGGSDIKIKENIQKVRVDEATGLNIYEFSYKGDPRRFEGVIAQEVEKVYPEAVTDTDLGFKAVNYEMLGLEMKELV
jgi:hypothetical protein